MNFPVYLRRSMLLLAFLLSIATAKAQQYLITSSADALTGPKHDVLSLPGGDYISITYPFEEDKDPIIVSRFDHDLKQKYTHPNPELAREHYRAAISADDRLFLLCSNKEGTVSRYEVNGNTGALNGAAANLFDLSAKEEDCTFFSGSATGKTFHYLLAKAHTKHEKGMTLQGAILDQQSNKLASFSFTTAEDWGNFSHLDVVQNNEGGLFLIYCVSVKTTKDNYTPWAYTVVTVDATGKTGSFALSGLPAGDLRNLSWMAKDNSLVFTGALAPGKKGGFRSIYSGTVDLKQNKVIDLRTTPIADLMTHAPDKYKGWMSENADLVQTLTLPDGSRILELEVKGDFDHQSYYPADPNSSNAAMANGTMASYSMTYFERNDLYLLKVDPTNTPQWLDIVAKRQTEPDMVLSTGTMVQIDQKGSLHLFFLDDKKNVEVASASTKPPLSVDGLHFQKFTPACVSVSPNGDTKKEFVSTQLDPAFRPMLEKAIVGMHNEACFLSIKTKIALTAHHLMNHAEFRIGTIRYN